MNTVSPAAGWPATPSLTALNAARLVNGLLIEPSGPLGDPGGVLSMNQTLGSTPICTVSWSAKGLFGTVGLWLRSLTVMVSVSMLLAGVALRPLKAAALV